MGRRGRLLGWAAGACVAVGLASAAAQAAGGVPELEAALAELEAALDAQEEATAFVDSAWVLLTSFLVLFMQAGFGALEAGSVRTKNVRNIVFKNVIDTCVGCVAFYVAGYALAFGGRGGGFAGADLFCLVRRGGGEFDQHDHFVLMFAFATTAATVVSGALAERVQVSAYVIYSSIMLIVIVPPVMHWAWHEDGWLHPSQGLLGVGVIDFAGSAVVHLAGGAVAVVGAALSGPRLDESGVARFAPGARTRDFSAWNITVTALGVFILWFCWFGFNCGSTLGVSGGLDRVARRAAANTMLSAAMSFVSTLLCSFWWRRSGLGFPLTNCLNGLLAGLVAITAGCAVVDLWAAAVIGAIGALVYLACSEGLVRLGIDDPLDAGPLHGGAGLWGALAVGLFAERSHIADAFGRDDERYGLVLSGRWEMLGAQAIGVLAITAWSMGTALVMFGAMRWSPWGNQLRASRDQELAGLDIGALDGFLYPPYLMPFVETLQKLHRLQRSVLEDSGQSYLGPGASTISRGLGSTELLLDPALRAHELQQPRNSMRRRGKGAASGTTDSSGSAEAPAGVDASPAE